MMPPAPTRIVEVPAGDVRDHDRRRRAGDAGHVVVLGQPEAAVAPALGVLREVERVGERLRRVAALRRSEHRSSTDTGITTRTSWAPHTAARPVAQRARRGVSAEGAGSATAALTVVADSLQRVDQGSPAPC